MFWTPGHLDSISNLFFIVLHVKSSSQKTSFPNFDLSIPSSPSHSHYRLWILKMLHTMTKCGTLITQKNKYIVLDRFFSFLCTQNLSKTVISMKRVLIVVGCELIFGQLNWQLMLIWYTARHHASSMLGHVNTKQIFLFPIQTIGKQ